MEKLIAQVAWSSVLSLHSLWWFGVQCHLLVLVHCVFWSPQSTQPSTRKCLITSYFLLLTSFMEMLISPAHIAKWLTIFWCTYIYIYIYIYMYIYICLYRHTHKSPWSSWLSWPILSVTFTLCSTAICWGRNITKWLTSEIIIRYKGLHKDVCHEVNTKNYISN